MIFCFAPISWCHSLSASSRRCVHCIARTDKPTAESTRRMSQSQDVGNKFLAMHRLSGWAFIADTLSFFFHPNNPFDDTIGHRCYAHIHIAIVCMQMTSNLMISLYARVDSKWNIRWHQSSPASMLCTVVIRTSYWLNYDVKTLNECTVCSCQFVSPFMCPSSS